jgi:hypothetical protein
MMKLLKLIIALLEYAIRLLEWLRFAPHIINPTPESDIAYMMREYAETSASYAMQTQKLLTLSRQIEQAVDNLQKMRGENTTYYTLCTALRELKGVNSNISRILQPWR